MDIIEEEVVEVRPETKSWSDVIQVIKHHKGESHVAVDMFIDMYIKGIEWDYKEELEAFLANPQNQIDRVSKPIAPLVPTKAEVLERAYAEIHQEMMSNRWINTLI